MGAIAYITDSKMLELHRLSAHSTMNFWRLSSRTSFTDFGIGDLVFFLSKDRDHMKKKEKGIVGFGRLQEIHQSSIKTMWKNFGELNGYNSLEEFTKAILKVYKRKEVPKKISSLYLVNVCFFQAPIYLSELGMSIPGNLESYTYLKPEEIALKILDYAKDSQDLWSSVSDNTARIDEEKFLYALSLAHKKAGETAKKETTLRKAHKTLKETEGYTLLQNSRTTAVRLFDGRADILFYHDKEIDDRMILGQSILYRHFLNETCRDGRALVFHTTDRNNELESLLNKEGGII